VKLSVKSDYAARAVLGLARHYPNGSTRRVEELAAEQGIPANYLIQILIELKAKQIVKSQRGKDGGYRLARPPGEITMGDVIRAIHGEVFDAPGMTDARSGPELRAAWLRLRGALEAAADAITFQQLIEEGQERGKMYYI
jgi:Rrf2 family protein